MFVITTLLVSVAISMGVAERAWQGVQTSEWWYSVIVLIGIATLWLMEVVSEALILKLADYVQDTLGDSYEGVINWCTLLLWVICVAGTALTWAQACWYICQWAIK